MIPKEETFNGTFPFEAHYSEAPGFRMHYVDEGSGEPIVLLHGEPTWGYLYRNMIGPLSEHHRVIVPDHMGFGKSATPQDREYNLRSHVENLTALIEDLDLSGFTLFSQDWGGPMATAYTVRNPERVARLFYANTVNAHAQVDDPGVPQLGDSRWFKWVDESVKTGRYDEILWNAGSTILSVMKLLNFTNSPAIDDAFIRAYQAPFSTREETVGAHAWPLEAHSGEFIEYVMEGVEQHGIEDLRSKPAMMAEGLEDKAIPPELAIANFRALWPDAPVVELPDAGHFVQEDASYTLVALIRQFVQSA